MVDSPRFCYVVLCHTDADAVLRLVRRIKVLSPNAAVLIRHDQPDFITSAEAEATGAALLHSDLMIAWGGWSMTQATLEAFAYAQSQFEASHFVLISGHDYPIRNLSEWEADVASSSLDALVNPMGAIDPETYAYRWREPTPAPKWIPAKLDNAAAFLVGRVQPLIASRARIYRNGRDRRWVVGVRRGAQAPPIALTKASQWLTLSRAAVEHVLHSYANDTDVADYFAHTRVPDETYIQSVVAAKPALTSADHVTTYFRLDADERSAVELSEGDLATAVETGAAFARKFAADADVLIAAADKASEG